MAVLAGDDLATLNRLKGRLDRDTQSRWLDGCRVQGFRSLKAYYGGRQRLEHLGLAIPADLRHFTTIVAWPRTYVDSIVGRLRPQGFLLNGEADLDLWAWWQANNLDSEVRMALVDMLVYGRGYLSTGAPDDGDTPLMTVESPLQMVHEWSNRQRRVTGAAKFYLDDTGGKKTRHATLKLPDVTRWLVKGPNGWEDDQDPDEHGLDRVMVAPLVNRASSDDRYGESEMSPVIGLTDAAARALTNAQVATEVMALPQRTAAGMTQADFTDPETGKALTAWESYFGAIWATANKDAKFDQFDAADLKNFDTIVSLYAKLVAGVTGLPMRYLGQLSDNPPSADGIRADEGRLVGTAEEKQEFAAFGFESAMLDAALVAGRQIDDDLMQMQTEWRKAAFSSDAQASDSAVKMHAENLYSRREALRAMGKTKQQIVNIEQELRDEAADGIAQALRALDAGSGA